MRGYTRTVFMGIDAATSSFERLEGYKRHLPMLDWQSMRNIYILTTDSFMSFLIFIYSKVVNISLFCINSYVAEKLLWYIHDKGLCRKNIPIVTFDDTSLGASWHSGNLYHSKSS